MSQADVVFHPRIPADDIKKPTDIPVHASFINWTFIIVSGIIAAVILILVCIYYMYGKTDKPIQQFTNVPQPPPHIKPKSPAQPPAPSPAHLDQTQQNDEPVENKKIIHQSKNETTVASMWNNEPKNEE